MDQHILSSDTLHPRGMIDGSTRLANVERLHRLATGCGTPEDLACHLKAIATYLKNARLGMCPLEALGIATPWGGRPWWDELALLFRDAVIRKVREEHFANLGITTAAKQIAQRARRLQGVALRRDNRQQTDADDLLLQAIKTGVPFPKARRIEDILRNET